MASFDPQLDAGWISATTPEQQYLVAKILSGDLDGARSFVEKFTAARRQKITEDSSLMLAALRENKPEFVRFLVEECYAQFEQLIETYVWDDDVLEDFITPLRYTARFKKTEAAAELMRLGANVNAVSPKKRRTALHDACENGAFVIVRHLIQHGADLTMKDDRGKTALMCGLDHFDVCRELLNGGAAVNATDDKRNTALHVAVGEDHKNPETVKLLLDYGAHLFKENDWGYDAHYIACRDRETDIVKVMRYQFSTDEVGHKALIRSHQLLGACYIEYSDPFGVYSRVTEALMEWETAVRLREERRHVITGEDDVVSTPNSAYDNAVEVDSILKFDEMRQDVNKICMQGLLLKEKVLGPTHFETNKSVAHLIEFYTTNKDYGRCLRLLRHGFKLARDPSLDSLTSKSHLDHLRERSIRHFGVINKLAINNTLDFNDVYEFLETIIDETRRLREPTIEGSSLMTVIFMQMALFLIKLFLLLEANEVNIAQFRGLVHDFVRLNSRSSRGRTVLMMAICPQNPFDSRWFSSDVDTIKLLLECGADTWETDNDGNSVLHLLAKSEQCILQATGSVRDKETNKKVAETLLAFDAHFDARNNVGLSAVDYMLSLGFDFSTHMTLQCLAAQVIRRHKIPYVGILPKSLVDFVQLH